MENNQQIEQFNKIKHDSLQIVEEVKDLTINGIDDKKGYEAVRAGKMRLVKQRTFINDERLAITRVFDKLKKDVIKMEDDLLEVMEPTEKLLAQRQKEIDDQKESIARKKALPERHERLKQIELEMGDEFLLLMSDKQFNEFFVIKKDEYLTDRENKLKEEQERQRLQKEANEREAQRLIDIENARKEEAEKAKKQAEIDKINAEKEKELALKRSEEAKQIALKKAEKEKEIAIKKAEEEKELALKRADEEKKLALQKEKAEKQAIIDKQKREESERLAVIEAQKREVEEREKRVKEENEKLEKRKKYQKFLSDNNYNEATDFVKTEGDISTLWRKIAMFKK